MQEAPATDVDRAALEAAKKVGMVPVAVAIPDWPYDSLDLVLFSEAAAAFEELTVKSRSRSVEGSSARRVAQYFPSVPVPVGGGFCSSGSVAPKSCQEMARVFSQVDLLLVPSLRV